MPPLGGTTSAILALKNPSIQFTVVDINSERIDAWNSTQIPIQEPGLIEVLSVVSEKYIRARPVERRVLALEGPTETVNHHQLGASADGEVRTSNLEFSKDVHGKISEADMIFITVNTPSKVSSPPIRNISV
ncbi:hypothetical protein J1614_010914 [Plenodomus biglobosus]|nr:hypothetical protein J1614_010914 [Plenodomus biglobosus]